MRVEEEEWIEFRVDIITRFEKSPRLINVIIGIGYAALFAFPVVGEKIGRDAV